MYEKANTFKKVVKFLAGPVAGAALGFIFGGPVGAKVGGLLGLVLAGLSSCST